LRILVLDQTHGGDRIGAEYVRRGHEVTLVDIYRTMKEEDFERARSQGMRPVLDTPAETFDIVVVPVHSPERFLGPAKYEQMISHHQAVGELVHFHFPIIEVTGAAAKTSTCFILAHMLSKLGKKVLLHSSRGDFEFGKDVKVLKERTSIAPASLLELSALNGYDVGIIEESLGGSGIGRVNVITTIGDDYKIAGGTKRAFDGKVQMASLAFEQVVYPMAEKSLWSPHVNPSVLETTFGPGGDVDVSFDEKLQLGVPLRAHLMIKGAKYDIELPSTFLAPAFKTAFQAAVAASLAYGVEAGQMAQAMEGFGGVPGRGEIEREGDWYMIRDRNPGVGARSIGWNLDIIENKYGVKDIGLVIDPVNYRICEKLDMDAIVKTAKSHPAVKNVYLFDRDAADSKLWSDLPHIKNVYDVWARHKVLLWCTKEGFH
jgi:coenzyme F430 synthetase